MAALAPKPSHWLSGGRDGMLRHFRLRRIIGLRSRGHAAAAASTNLAGSEARVLRMAPGLIYVDKPSGLCPGFFPNQRRRNSRRSADQLTALLESKERLQVLGVFGSQHEASTSGVAVAATSSRSVSELAAMWRERRAEEIYTAILRGLLPLRVVVRCSARLCRPSEGSTAWRLAGTRREGVQAYTLVHGIAHGEYNGEPCTLAELRPVTGLEQQLRLHCVALGHPIVGDEVHEADRRLDFRYGKALPAPRLMLHCRSLNLVEASGGEEIVSPDPLAPLLRPPTVAGADAEAASGTDFEQDGHRDSSWCPLQGDAVVEGLTNRLHEPLAASTSAWATFAGGLGDAIRADTHWDAYRPVRKFRGPPWGPAEWDDRNPRHSLRYEGVASD